MAVEQHIKDPSLAAVLETSRNACEQAMALAELMGRTAAAAAAANGTGSTSPNVLAQLVKQQKLLNTHLAHLRGLHRAAQMAARATKAQTAEARHEVDRLHLQLSNLYYEQRHLEGEIAACESFELVSFLFRRPDPDPDRSPEEKEEEEEEEEEERKGEKKGHQYGKDGVKKERKSSLQTSDEKSTRLTATTNASHTYQQLPLIPVEEFLALHPEHANDDETELMIARIHHERAEREALEQKRLELVKRKQKLVAENKKRSDDLANLDKNLEKFIDGGQPIQKLFEKVV